MAGDKERLMYFSGTFLVDLSCRSGFQAVKEQSLPMIRIPPNGQNNIATTWPDSNEQSNSLKPRQIGLRLAIIADQNVEWIETRAASSSWPCVASFLLL